MDLPKISGHLSSQFGEKTLKFSDKFIQWFSFEKKKCPHKYWNSADTVSFFEEGTTKLAGFLLKNLKNTL